LGKIHESLLGNRRAIAKGITFHFTEVQSTGFRQRPGSGKTDSKKEYLQREKIPLDQKQTKQPLK
jgi:hypothetical protein